MARAKDPGAVTPVGVVTHLVGGHVALDLVNTVSWRMDPDRYRNKLTDLPAVIAWCRRAEVIEEPTFTALAAMAAQDVPSGARVLEQVIALREQLAEVLAVLVDTSPTEADLNGGEPAATAVVPPALHARLTEALTRSHLAGVPARWHLTARQLDDVPHLLGLHALDLLQSPRLPQLGRCQGAGCGWYFLDGTRSHTRRWCATGDCGNRERARRHYARTSRAGGGRAQEAPASQKSAISAAAPSDAPAPEPGPVQSRPPGGTSMGKHAPLVPEAPAEGQRSC